jgi:hypothetical protein
MDLERIQREYEAAKIGREKSPNQDPFPLLYSEKYKYLLNLREELRESSILNEMNRSKIEDR